MGDPVCSTCNDTHMVLFRRDGEADRNRMCTQCPVPCRKCAGDGGTGAYCAKTPCPCECHARHSQATPTTERTPVRRVIGQCAECASYEVWRDGKGPGGRCHNPEAKLAGCVRSPFPEFGCIHWVARETKGGGA